MKALVVLLVMSIALAGCGDKKGSAPAEVEEPEGNSIRGVVVTPTIQPITGATVTLAPSGVQETTDLFGRFSFAGLEPGTYTVRAAADNHETSVVQVQVIDGEVARPRIQLNPTMEPVARHETLTFTGIIPGHFGAADDAVSDYKEQLGFPPCDCDFFFSVPDSTVAITLEAYWEDSIGGPDGLEPAYRWRVSPFTVNHAASGAEPSPLHEVLVEESFVGEGPFTFQGVDAMRLRLDPDENWPTTDQGFEIYLTIWEVELPPDGWSFVQGDR